MCIDETINNLNNLKDELNKNIRCVDEALDNLYQFKKELEYEDMHRHETLSNLYHLKKELEKEDFKDYIRELRDRFYEDKELLTIFNKSLENGIDKLTLDEFFILLHAIDIEGYYHYKCTSDDCGRELISYERIEGLCSFCIGRQERNERDDERYNRSIGNR